MAGGLIDRTVQLKERCCSRPVSEVKCVVMLERMAGRPSLLTRYERLPKREVVETIEGRHCVEHFGG